MNKKISEFESLSDFGYKTLIKSNGKVDFIKCDCTLDKISDGMTSNVYTNGDITIGKYFSLEDILSGGNQIIPSEDHNLQTQAELSLDYTIPSSLAYLGSIYSTIQISLNNIKSKYPNGYTIVSSLTGVNSMMFNTSDTFTYGSLPFSQVDITDYELVQVYSGVYDQTFQIESQVSGLTYVVLILDGQPSNGTVYEHIVQPKQTTLDKLYSRLNQYEKDLLVPPYNRTNYWPRDLIAPNNILMDGTRFDTFVETELSWAEEADNEESNFIWRKLYPDGQKILDSEDGLMQKLVLAMAMNFDNIKRYQDQLKYQHTIGYETSNHVAKNLIEIMSNQWNWDAGHKLNQDDYGNYIYSLYENYVTGQSQQKISAKDVNFEMWRRILANLVTLYKKKGTKEAIKYVANIYGLPEELLWIDELVEIASSKKTELIESESNIIVPIDGQSWYIDDNGSAKTLSYRVIKNTKYLNVNISPFDAIDFDLYDWGSVGHPSITNVNGASTTLVSSTATQREFFSNIYKATIKSDGSSRYENSYPLLENEGAIYYNTSTNKMTLSTLDPYMDFLDDNWNILITNLIPASSKLISLGTLYKNPMWRREKHQWNDSELDQRQLPLNEEIIFDVFNPSIEVNKTKAATIVQSEPIAKSYKKNSAIISSPQLVSSKGVGKNASLLAPTISGNTRQKMSCHMELQDPTTEYYTPPSDSETIDYIYSSTTYQIASPMFEPISGQYGTLEYVNYSNDSLVVTNQNTFPVTFSAYNLSDSGYTKLEIDLFKKYSEESIVVDETRIYSILSVDYEENTYGMYRVSNLSNIDTYDYISIQSEYLPYINNIVQVTHIDTGTSQIRTSPKIGLFNLPVSQDNSRVDWIDYFRVGAYGHLGGIYLTRKQTFQEMIQNLKLIAENIGDQSIIQSLNAPESIKPMYEWFTIQNVAIIYGSLLIVEFLKGNKTYTFETKDYIVINAVTAYQSKATFKRVVNFFNWASPTQMISYTNYPTGYTGNFILPTINTNSRTSANTYSTTGTVSIGGLDSLNAEILVDKTEYFYRTRAITHAPKEWEIVAGLPKFEILESGGTLLDSGFDLNYVNGVKYYGRYFMFMKTPKVPIGSLINAVSVTSSSPNPNYSLTNDASVTARWNGVGDSNRMELQYLNVPSISAYTSYTQISESSWSSTSAITISVPSRVGIGDDYIYTIQTTLEPDTYYWWRVKNFRNKINMFGHNLEYFTSTEPKLLLTGGFAGSGRGSGEVPVEPTPPTPTIGVGKNKTELQG